MSQKIQLIGRYTYHNGKTLWEILGNLKNYGVGRLVTRNRYVSLYKEPCFYKIFKVETCAALPEPSYDQYRKVVVWVERVFRGRKMPNYVQLYRTSYKPDYLLIRKEDEEQWIRRYEECNKKSFTKIFPAKMYVPPLLKEIIKSELTASGEEITEDKLMMNVFIKQRRENVARLAKPGETPTHNYEYGFGTPKHCSLVENIEAVREYYTKERTFEPEKE